MQKEEIENFYPINQIAWRKWLEENHTSQKAVWLIYYKKKTNKPTITWSEAVDEALCFGWIDSTRKTLDDEKSIQFFTQRKPNSTWSKINKEKTKQLIDKGLMKEAGLASIETAKQNGSWIILDEVEELIIPKDLETEFETYPNSKDFFLSLSKSVKKMILYWLVSAKRPETRHKRISEIIEYAEQKLKPKHLQ